MVAPKVPRGAPSGGGIVRAVVAKAPIVGKAPGWARTKYGPEPKPRRPFLISAPPARRRREAQDWGVKAGFDLVYIDREPLPSPSSVPRKPRAVSAMEVLGRRNGAVSPGTHRRGGAAPDWGIKRGFPLVEKEKRPGTRAAAEPRRGVPGGLAPPARGVRGGKAPPRDLGVESRSKPHRDDSLVRGGCKARPTDNTPKGRGGSRRFVPWCERRS